MTTPAIEFGCTQQCREVRRPVVCGLLAHRMKKGVRIHNRAFAGAKWTDCALMTLSWFDPAPAQSDS